MIISITNIRKKLVLRIDLVKLVFARGVILSVLLHRKRLPNLLIYGILSNCFCCVYGNGRTALRHGAVGVPVVQESLEDDPADAAVILSIQKEENPICSVVEAIKEHGCSLPDVSLLLFI